MLHILRHRGLALQTFSNKPAVTAVVQFEIAPTNCPPRIGGQRDREADPARGGSYSQGKLFDLATTPALRATPPVPGGEPEFQTETLPRFGIGSFSGRQACVEVQSSSGEGSLRHRRGRGRLYPGPSPWGFVPAGRLL